DPAGREGRPRGARCEPRPASFRGPRRLRHPAHGRRPASRLRPRDPLLPRRWSGATRGAGRVPATRGTAAWIAAHYEGGGMKGAGIAVVAALAATVGASGVARAAEPTFKNGLAQAVFTTDTTKWISYDGYVQSNTDSDHDGKLDRIHFDVT